MRTIGLYVHFPWCVKKCPYCDFNSHPLRGALDEERYVTALRADLSEEASHVDDRLVDTVFFGGGTPSLFSPPAFARLLSEFRSTLHLDEDAEVTMEANPGTLEQGGDLTAYRNAGINRISLGAQTFDSKQLERLGRIHSSRDSTAAAEGIRNAGFDQFNIDLMYGLPAQSQNAALDDLRKAIALGPTHISWYQLTIEPRTEFAQRPPTLPSDDLIAEMGEAGAQLLRAEGYERYEVSAYARPGCRSRHNLNYWEFGDYLGIGAGAHGKLTTGRGVVRTEKPKQPRLYLDRRQRREVAVDEAELPLEFMMNVLRLVEGVTEASFTKRTGMSLTTIDAVLATLRQAGLMQPDRIALTPHGYNHLDAVVERFL